MSDYQLKITSKGAKKFSSAIAEKSVVELVQIAVGSADGSLLNEDSTSLGDEKLRIDISKETSDTQVMLSGEIPADVGGFYINEIGVYDVDSELLIFGKYQNTYKPIIDEASGASLKIEINLTIDNTDAIQINSDGKSILSTNIDNALLQAQNYSTTAEQHKTDAGNSANTATDAAEKAEAHENNIIDKVEEINDVAENGGPSLTTHYNAINSRETTSALGFMGYEGEDIATYTVPLSSYDLNIGFSIVFSVWIPSKKPTYSWYNNTNIGHLWAGYIDANNHAQIYKSDDTHLHFAVTVDGVTQAKYYTGCYDIASVFYFGWDSEKLSVYCNGTELVGETSTITIATGNQTDCCTIGALKTDTQITSNLKFNLMHFWLFNRELGRDSNHSYANYTLTDAINGVTPPNNYRTGDVYTVDWSDGIALPKLGLAPINNYGAIDADVYDLLADPDSIGGSARGSHAIKINPTTQLGVLLINPNYYRGDYFVITGWYYAPSGCPNIWAQGTNAMRAEVWLSGSGATKNQWEQFTVLASGQYGSLINSNGERSGQLRLGRFSPSTVPLYFADLSVTRLGTTIMIGGANLRIPQNHNQIADASNNNNPLTIQRYITPTQPGEYGCYTEQGLIIDGRLLAGVDDDNYIESVVITNTSNNTITGVDLRTSTSSTTQLFSPVDIAGGSSHIATINQSITGALYYYATSWNGAEITITLKIRKK